MTADFEAVFNDQPVSKSPIKPTLAPVTAPIAAKVLGITRRQFDRLVTNGVLPRHSPRLYDLLAVGPAYFQYVSDGRAENSSIAEARLKLTVAQRQAIEQRTKERAGELVELASVRLAFSAVMVSIAASLEGLPGRLSGQLAGIDQPPQIHEVLQSEIRRIRETAQADLARIARGDRRDADEAAAAAPGERVG